MSRVTFKFKNGMERKMMAIQADLLFKRGLGTYMTSDMGHKPTIIKAPAAEVDSTGDEWNPDLHVASKLKNQNGTWRKKPGASAAAQESAE